MDKMSQMFMQLFWKASPAVVVPLASYLLALWSGRRVDSREAEVKQKLISLKELEETAPALGDEVISSQLREYVRKRRNQLVSELLAVSAERERHMAALASGHTVRPWQRWFLLYAPSGARAWILHLLFFVSSALVLLGCIEMLKNPNDPDLAQDALGFGIIAVMALIFRTLAVWFQRGARATRVLPAWANRLVSRRAPRRVQSPV